MTEEPIVFLKINACKACGSIPEILYSVRKKQHIVNCDNLSCVERISRCSLSDYIHLDSESEAVDTWNKNGGLMKTQTAMIEEELIKNGIYADKFKHVFNMKTFDGRTLLDIIDAGEGTAPYVEYLINEAKLMEEAYKRSGLADSKAPATDDWKATISIPRCENE